MFLVKKNPRHVALFGLQVGWIYRLNVSIHFVFEWHLVYRFRFKTFVSGKTVAFFVTEGLEIIYNTLNANRSTNLSATYSAYSRKVKMKDQPLANTIIIVMYIRTNIMCDGPNEGLVI